MNTLRTLTSVITIKEIQMSLYYHSPITAGCQGCIATHLHRYLVCTQYHTTHCTLHTIPYNTHHTAHNTIQHTPHCTLYRTTHTTLHTIPYNTHHTAHNTIQHTPHCTLYHTTHTTLHTIPYNTHHTAHNTIQHTPHCTQYHTTPELPGQQVGGIDTLLSTSVIHAGRLSQADPLLWRGFLDSVKHFEIIHCNKLWCCVHLIITTTTNTPSSSLPDNVLLL